ncbi:MAG: YbaN family protein [Clostridia bacterium]|nr:YbaN family protein [Clostridia bacterium]
MKKNIYLILASIFVVIGTIGIFVPLLPTTPFLLLSVYFYTNSSYKRLKWLLNNRYLGPYIHDYISKKRIPLRLKIKTISLLWITLAIGFFFATDNLHVRLFLIAVGIGVSIHIFTK